MLALYTYPLLVLVCLGTAALLLDFDLYLHSLGSNEIIPVKTAKL
jgi:hypothetical protein